MKLFTGLFLVVCCAAAPPPPVVTNSTNITGNGITVTFPGKFAVEIGASDVANTGEYKGLAGMWDLKNDPDKKNNACGFYVGCDWLKLNWINTDTACSPQPQCRDRQGDGGSEFESPGALTMLEKNDVRTQVKYHFQMRRYGTDAVDCCISADKYFTMEYPDKVFVTTKISYSGADGMGPLTWKEVTMIPSVTWARAANEPARAGVPGVGPCEGPPLNRPATPSPWIVMWQDPASPVDRPKTWSLFSTDGTSAYPTSNDCNGAGNPGLPTPGLVSHCAVLGCATGGIDRTVPMKMNILWMASAADTYVYPYGAFPEWFPGGFRLEMEMEKFPPPLVAGTDVYSHHISYRVGDNGITSNAVAEEYSTEYRGVIAPTMTMGTVAGDDADVYHGFDQRGGAYVMTAGASGVSFTTSNVQHYPVFQVSNWGAAVPSTITVGGSSKSLGVDYIAAKSDPDTLLLQSLAGSVPDGTAWVIPITVAGGTCEATGTCFYVDSHPGTGPGSFAAPFGQADLLQPSDAVPGTAFQALHPGDTLYFRGGDYSTFGALAPGHSDHAYFSPVRSGTPGNPITISNYPSEGVTLKYGGGSNPNPLPVIGTPGYSYIRIMGFTVDVSTAQAVNGMFIGNDAIPSSNVEVGYNKIIGQLCTSCGPTNYDGIYAQNIQSAWIHHNDVSNFTLAGDCANGAGIKLYTLTDALLEKNLVHGNCIGIFDKDAGTSGSFNAFSGNFLTGNTQAQWAGSNQGVAQTDYLSDNVIDGSVIPVYSSVAGTVGANMEVHNNLFRGSPGVPFLQWGNTGVNITGLKQWNNIYLAGGANIPFQNTTQRIGGPPAIFSFLDYEVFDGPPQWNFNIYNFPPPTQLMSLADMRAAGYELPGHSFVDSPGNIFQDLVSYALKPPYNRNGRYGDTMGPKGISIAEIMDTRRYGPGARNLGLGIAPNFSGGVILSGSFR